MNFVLDCSVTAGWLLKSQSDDYTESVLDCLENQDAIVPVLWIYEISNVLAVAEKKKMIQRAEGVGFLKMLHELNISIETLQEIHYDELIYGLGSDYRLTAYDSAYLRLAMARHLPLATKDEDLKKACAKAGVKIFDSSRI